MRDSEEHHDHDLHIDRMDTNMDMDSSYGCSKTSSMTISEAFQGPGEDVFSEAEARTAETKTADAKALQTSTTPGSPLTLRQVSIGSATSPSLDVTPVTRNTSQLLAQISTCTPSTSCITSDHDGCYGNIVTPEPSQGILHEGILPEKHFALPPDISAPNTEHPGLHLIRASMFKLRSNSVDHLFPHTIRKALAATLGDELQEEYPFAVQDPVPFSPYRYDLTPASRNASQPTTEQPCADASTPSTSISDLDGCYGNTVTPEPSQGILHEGILPEKHFAFPVDISAPNTRQYGSDLDLDLTGPSKMPKLRANSLDDHLGSYTIRKALAATLGDELLQEEFAMQYPLPYRKLNSFTNRQQYEHELCMQHTGHDDLYNSTRGMHVGSLKPYQPSRQEDFGGVGNTMPEEVLEGIFIARRRSSDVSDCSLSPILMEERQWSIPSIHRAHALQGTDGSVNTSYTEHTEDGESLLFGHGHCDEYDDASLSSHCSSLYRPAGETSTAGDSLHLSSRSPFPRHILHTAQRDQTKDEGTDDYAELSGYAVYDYGERSLAVDRRKRKQRQRKERAFEWLQSVEGSNHVFAEAASSKFLTGNGNRRRRLALAAKGENRGEQCSRTSGASGFAESCDTSHAPTTGIILVGDGIGECS